MRRKIYLLAVKSLLLLCLAVSVQAQNVMIRHSFTNSPDGANPWQLFWTNGIFYGATLNGGANGYGSLFKFDTNGAVYSRIYDFTGATNNGNYPHTPLVVGNMIYGTTQLGGTNYSGTVYAVNTNGTGFTLLHSFGPVPDGNTPLGGLVLSSNMLFGTASVGGISNGGAIFGINTNGGGYTILHSFTNTPDGFSPRSELVLVSNMLYGTTIGGGGGNGTIFAVNVNGSGYTVLHGFTNSPDGNVSGGLTFSGGVLYGLTGGSNGNTNGTIYSINADGSGFQVLHRFLSTGAATNADGKTPKGTLSASGNCLLGTTANGGIAGGGVVFLVNTNGSGFAVLNYFTNNSAAGWDLENGVIRAGGSVWGTTFQGGSSGFGTLFSLALPVIAAQPQDLTVTNNNNATFAVSAVDSLAMNYQWYFNTNTLLTGQTGSTLTLTNVQTTNSGAYTVAVSDSFGSITSRPANLLVIFQGTPPFITQQPQNATVTNGNSVSFTNFATGTAPIYYNWYLNTNTFLGSNTNGILTINPATTNSRGFYSVVVTNAYGSTNSAAALLTVIVPVIKPGITQQPQNITVTNGYDATFTNVATGTQPLNYQWYFNTNTPVASGTNAILTVPSVATNNAGFYTVVVTNAAGATTSSPALLTVVSTKPIIFVQPQNAAVTLSNTATFSVTAAGRNPLRYQWYYNTVSNALGTLLAGQTNSIYSLTATTNVSGRYYSVLITNTLGKATSSPALLTVVTKPLITTNPQPQTVTAGDTTTFSVSALGPNLAYQWYSNSVSASIGTPLNGQTSSVYSFTAGANHNGRYYSVVVTNIYGKATSSPPALLTVLLPAGQPQFLSVAFLPASRSISITVSNTASSANRLWASTNLAGNFWQVIASNTMAGNGLWMLTDTNVVTTNQMRFYRASCP